MELRDQGARLTVLPATDSVYRQFARRLVGPDSVARVLAVEHTKQTNVALDRLNPLRVLSGVLELHIDNLENGSLKPLQDATQLQSLIIRESQIRTTADLGKLTRLNRLQITHCPLQDIVCVRNMQELKYLSLHDTMLVDLSPIQGLTELVSIDVSGCPARDLAPLGRLKNLSSLNAEKSGITSVEGLQNCPRLQSLDISHTEVKSLTPLRDIGQLKWLNVRGCPLTDEQIKEFQQWLPACDVYR